MNNNNTIRVFDYQDSPIRYIIDNNGEPWLVAKDVCDYLEIANARDAISSLDDDEKMTVANPDSHSGQRGGAQFLNFINEPGLYKLTFRSKKPNAKELTRKVTHEILPSINKYGSYSLPEKAKPAVKHKEKKTLPQISAPVKAAEKIVNKLFKCKKNEDFEAVIALDKVYFATFGQSAIVSMNYRIIKNITRVILFIGTGVITHGEEEISYSLCQADKVSSELLSDEACIEVVHHEDMKKDTLTPIPSELCANNSFGQNLKALRKKVGLTQEELAHRLEVTSKTISNWELGNFMPTVNDIKKLAEALGVSEQQLLAPDTRPSGWVLTVRMVHDYRKEVVIDVSKDIPCESRIFTDNTGGLLVLGGSYELWKDDNQFKKLVKELNKLRFTVLQNGRDHGAIKD